MRIVNLNQNWIFQQGEPSRIPSMPAQTREVNLPHDFVIETDVRADSKNGPNTGYYSGGTYTYTKMLTIPEDWKGQQVKLSFDGVMGSTKVVVNGHMAGIHHYGYTPFRVDIAPYLYYGQENRISVTISNDNEPNSRWYSGGGIYRDVALLVAPQVHIAPSGLYVHTDHFVGEDAFIVVETTVENHTGADRCAWVELAVTEDGGTEAVAHGKIKVFLPAHKTAVARTQLCIENVKRWDIDSPNLYRIHAVSGTEEGLIDEADVTFGVRTVSVDAKHGFCLNGRPLKLKGGCLHHDNGILGAASFCDAEYRRVKLHKDNGYNALRMAHNPASSALLEACDRLGILVMEEAFDVWRMQKKYYDFSQYFDTEWEKELESFMLRDRNHPSIIMWSIGNELPEQGGLSRGYETSAKLAEAVRRLDPTRPVCGALCSFFHSLDDQDNGKYWKSLMEEAAAIGGMPNNLDGKYGREIWNERTEAFAAPWDVVGYNYLDYHYEEAGKLFPDRVICCTESKPGQMESYWHDVEKYPYLIGDFVWTSMDYLGEAGIGKTLYVEPDQPATAARSLRYAEYPWRTAGCGDFDLCGFERPQLAYRRILWGSRETHIICHDPRNNGKLELLGRYGWPESANSWTWPVDPGTPVKVEVFSAAPEVELLVNGRSMGKAATTHNKAQFQVPYDPGELTAISFDGEQEISRDSIHSAGAVAGLKITADKTVLAGDGSSLCFATVELVDADGNPVPYAEAELSATVEGCATLQAFGSARPKTEENYTRGKGTTYHGKLLAVIRAGTESGTALLRVSSSALGTAELALAIGQNTETDARECVQAKTGGTKR